jgi:uncharacterized protein YndB with AHSA1/START domain
MRAEASREIPASRDQLWGFLAEPYHLSDWWPGVAAVRPDRRGLMPGARWELTGPSQPTLFHSANARGMLVVGRVDPYERVTWTLLDQRLEVEVRLTTMAPDRTRVTVAIEGPWRPEVLGRPRSLPRKAVARLHALVQTAASL